MYGDWMVVKRKHKPKDNRGSSRKFASEATGRSEDIIGTRQELLETYKLTKEGMGRENHVLRRDLGRYGWSTLN